MKFYHLSTFGVSTGDSVAQGGYIGKSGQSGVGTGPHLHFAFYQVTTLNGVNYQLTDNMWSHYQSLGPTQWRNGQDLDFYKNWSNTSPYFELHAYAVDSGTSYVPSSVTIFHRKYNETSWRSSTMSQGTYDPTDFWYNFSNESAYQSGDYLYIIVRATSTLPNPEDSYPYSFAPPYYKKPDTNVANWPAINQVFHMIR